MFLSQTNFIIVVTAASTELGTNRKEHKGTAAEPPLHLNKHRAQLVGNRTAPRFPTREFGSFSFQIRTVSIAR